MKTEYKEDKYPKPDISYKKPNLVRTVEDKNLDIGWAEGVLSDGRPYWVGFWCLDQTSFFTFFMSTIGLEKASTDDLLDILDMEGLVKFKQDKENMVMYKQVDASGNEMWCITVAIAYGSEVVLEGEDIIFYPYKKETFVNWEGGTYKVVETDSGVASIKLLNNSWERASGTLTTTLLSEGLPIEDPGVPSVKLKTMETIFYPLKSFFSFLFFFLKAMAGFLLVGLIAQVVALLAIGLYLLSLLLFGTPNSDRPGSSMVDTIRYEAER